MTQIDHGVAGSAVCGLLSPYDALCVWRSHQEAAGRPGIDAVKDVYLMQIARGDDLSSAQAITQRLPRSLAPTTVLVRFAALGQKIAFAP